MIILKSKDDEISHLVATPLLTIQKKLPLFIQSRTTFLLFLLSALLLSRRNKMKTKKNLFKLLNV